MTKSTLIVAFDHHAATTVAAVLMPGQTIGSISGVRGLRAKGLEVIVHDLVEHTPGGIPRFVARGGPDHQVP